VTVEQRSPRALVVGQDRQESPLRYLVRGMRSEGWEVSCVNPDEFFLRPPGFTGRLLQRATHRLSWAGVSHAIMEKAAAIDPDLVLGIKSLPLSPGRRAQLRARGAKLALWYPDVSFDHGAAVRDTLFHEIDLFATSKHFHLPYLAEQRPQLATTLVEHGYCDDVHYPIQPPGEADFDVGYVGNYSPHKHAALTALAEARPALTIAVSGHGWRADGRWRVFPALVGEEMARFLSRAKIALAVHYGPHGSHGWEDTTSARTFEIPACGGFMLHPDNEEVRRYFHPDREIGVFKDLADIAAQADYWLADDGRRAAAAAQARARARPAYSYSERGRRLARWLIDQGAAARVCAG